MNNQRRVSLIIPAFNEEGRIGAVLDAATHASVINEIIVVSDGSTDRTAEKADEYGVRVERLETNVGKGGAMLRGAMLAEHADIVIFLDADLIGINPSHIDALVEPVLRRESAMAIGQFVGGRGVTDLAQFLVKCISGQRAIERDLFLSIPNVDTVGYGVEMLITLHVSRLRLETSVVQLRGVTHPMKEEKHGFVLGAIARARMYWQMGSFWTVYSLSGHPPNGNLMQISDERDVVVRNGSREDHAVDPVENAPVTR